MPARHKRAPARLAPRLVIGLCLALGLLFGPSSSPPLAVASTDLGAKLGIQGVWAFNGGKIAVTEKGSGRLVGIVVAATKFAQCTHPAGEEIWPEIVAQPDGSYFGLHRWFYETADCTSNPTPGPTAWRVLRDSRGIFLRVCFSEPGSSAQPTISAGGEVANSTFGCVDSARVSVVPRLRQSSFRRYVKLPRPRACLARRLLRIRLVDPQGDPFERIQVTARAGRVEKAARVVHEKAAAIALIGLRGLPGNRVVVRVSLTTLLGQRLTGKRVYRRCPVRTRHRGKHR